MSELRVDRCSDPGTPSKRDKDSSSSSSPSTASLAARLVEPPQHVVDFAVEVSMWSPCRSKRGVVIFDGDDILSHGYNYKPHGFDCDGSEACKATCREEAVHAEQQALLAHGPKVVRGSEMLHVKTVNGALVASGGPSCVQCSKLALVCGIAGVWLFHEDGWRQYPTAEFHRLSLTALQAGRLVDPRSSPIALNEQQEAAAKQWAADDRLWTTQDTVEFNLRTFARVILKESAPGRLVDPSPPQKNHEELESRMDTPGSASDSLTAPTGKGSA